MPSSRYSFISISNNWSPFISLECFYEVFLFQINNLVSQKTEGKIQDLLLEQDVDTLTKMILINVIYFKGLFGPNLNKEIKTIFFSSSVEEGV